MAIYGYYMVILNASNLDSQNALDLFVMVITFLNSLLPSISENVLYQEQTVTVTGYVIINV